MSKGRRNPPSTRPSASRSRNPTAKGRDDRESCPRRRAHGTPRSAQGRAIAGNVAGGSIVVYGIQSGQFPALSPRDFVFRGLGLHGFWLLNWLRDAPRREIQETYQKLGELVADRSLSAEVEHVYPLERFKEAVEQSLKSNRKGKILFKFARD
jgi:NADPH:quinone reductase-like Zn-dependent oxidoreductase